MQQDSPSERRPNDRRVAADPKFPGPERRERERDRRAEPRTAFDR